MASSRSFRGPAEAVASQSTESGDRVRVGVVGTGSFGRNHVRILSELECADLVGVLDSDPVVAETMAAEHGTRVFSSLSALAESCSAAVLAVPTVAHAEVGCQLLEAGLHVLVEKPIATSLEEADQLVRAAREADRVLAVGHVEFYNPAVQALIQLGASPGYVEIQRRAGFSPRSLDIDVVLDLMIHDLQILHRLDPSPVAEIRATGIPVLSDRTDIANVRIQFDSGGVANLTASRVSVERDRKLRAFFSRRYFSLDYEAQEIKGYRLEERESGRSIEPENLKVEKGEPLRLELMAFLDRCGGGGADIADGEQGRRALKTGLEIVEIIASGGTTVQ